MSDRPRSSQELIEKAMEEVAKLPPGSDVAGFITRKFKELGPLFAKELAETRETASQEADFSPSAMPQLRSRGDETGQEAAPQDDGPSRGGTDGQPPRP